jgi:UDP-2,3-diacylglucosamine pyrophosphatase LpxH
MPGDANGTTTYVVSDLHVGGDEQLEQADFLPEFLAFLERIAEEDGAELIINGDAFGLWEITTASGPAKFDVLLESYPKLFDQFRETGASTPITLVPGNHDHDLAAYEAYVDRLAEYNVDLVRNQTITRDIGETAVHFEHGNQQDPNNAIEDWGNPHVTPLGYYYNTHITSRAGHLSDRGRFDWLKDVQAVTPTQRLPNWLVSKYFYREMNPALRYAAVPFLLLFNVSALLAILAGLDLAGLWELPATALGTFLDQFGLAGATVQLVLTINVAVAGLLVLVGIPLSLLVRDVRGTVDRFGIFETDLTVHPEEPYADTAREVFGESDASIFCYGHTHRSSTQDVEGGLLVNTGTWLKRLHRREAFAGRLPPVFYPSYQLTVVRMEATDDGGIAVTHEEIEKPSPATDELTLTERLLTLGREPDPTLPDPVVVAPDGTVRSASE